MTNFVEEMIKNTWSSGSRREKRRKKNRKWGFTIFRAYYSEESDEAWQMLLYSLKHQMKLSFGAYEGKKDVKQDDIQRLKDLFSLDVREDPSLFDGIDIPGLRKFVNNEKEEKIEVVERPGLWPYNIWPEEVLGMADWEFDYVLLADQAVLRDVANGEFIVKAVSLRWRKGRLAWGWMRIPTGYLLELWQHLMVNDSHTERALYFKGAEEELESLIWAGDTGIGSLGDYSEIRPGWRHYSNQSLRCLS